MEEEFIKEELTEGEEAQKDHAILRKVFKDLFEKVNNNIINAERMHFIDDLAKRLFVRGMSSDVCYRRAEYLWKERERFINEETSLKESKTLEKKGWYQQIIK